MDRRSLSQRERTAIHLRQGGRCAVCNLKLRVGGYEIDHIQALIHGGTNDTENLRAICLTCHKAKTRGDVQANATRMNCRFLIWAPPAPSSRVTRNPFQWAGRREKRSDGHTARVD